MNDLLKTESIPALLISIVVFLCASFIRSIVEFLWKIQKKKESASESAIKELTDVVKKNTQATEHLDQRLCDVEGTFSELPKLKQDMRKFYLAVKLLSGDKWAQIRKDIEDETL